MILKVPIYVDVQPGLTPDEIPVLVDFLCNEYYKILRKRKMSNPLPLEITNKKSLAICEATEVISKKKALEFLRTGIK
jgi:hypothetical protein